MIEIPGEQLYDSIFIARQPIFTAKMHVWGYELLFRHGGNAREAIIVDGDQATTQVIADGFGLAVQGMRKGTKALINFPRNVLVGAAPYVLPPERCVVEILETVLPEAEVLQACQKLKSKGYLLALDDFVGDPGFEPLCELADIVKVDILHKTPAQVAAIVNGLSKYKTVLLAEKVENQQMFTVCKKLGFTFFQGYFFSRPEIIPGRKLSSSQTSKIKLLKELSNTEAELSRLVEIIQTDLSISYRLLRYINSARFGLRGKIESIQRAAAMLGHQNLRQWLQIVILSDVNTTDKAQELVRISVQRGYFLQLLAAARPTPFDRDGMFLLGLFSVLDAILDQRMIQILDEIPLDGAIKSALVNADDPNAVWLGLVNAIDRGNWAELDQRSAALGIPLALVDSLSAEAFVWADEVMGSGA
jgi:EAL and modified HD-GYP domain-containing signal transduction protein